MIHVDKEMMKPIFFTAKMNKLMRIIRSIFELKRAEIEFPNYVVKCLHCIQF